MGGVAEGGVVEDDPGVGVGIAEGLGEGGEGFFGVVGVVGSWGAVEAVVVQGFGSAGGGGEG